jgi:alkanesulfonate monooxygenase SsuD/methylene tetrahydromethanopterin reductase-like flavin-dependent oxidoreductase (luciferase family)
VLRTLWREPVASFHGATIDFDHIKLTTHPVQASGVPIIVGGHSNAALRRAGRLGDAFLPAMNVGQEPDAWPAMWAAVQGAAAAADRPAGAVELHGFGDTLEHAHRLRDLGATRMIHSVLEPDLPRAIAHLDRFAAEVIGRFA